MKTPIHAMRDLLAEDERFKLEAYQFIREALQYAHENITTIDGVKIDFAKNWVHLRKSNTEPIIRIYTEGKSQIEADVLADNFIGEIKEIAII